MLRKDKNYVVVRNFAIINHFHYLVMLHVQRYTKLAVPTNKRQIYLGATPTNAHIYRVSLEECARLREGVPYVKVYRYNPKQICPKLNGYGDNGQRIPKL